MTILKPFSVILFIFLFLPCGIYAQTAIPVDSLSNIPADSLNNLPVDLNNLPADTILQIDSVASQSIKDRKKALKKENLSSNDSITNKKSISQDNTEEIPKIVDYKPDPIKVVWMGMIIPGYGQIINRDYWKLPLVYSAYLGCAFAINYYSTNYEIYRTAYHDIRNPNPDANSYLDLLQGGTIESYPGGLPGLEKNLEAIYKNLRRNRDLSIIISIAVYGISIIEAYVAAQLYDFDISPDLSLQIHPTVLTNHFGKVDLAGIGFSFRLK